MRGQRLFRIYLALGLALPAMSVVVLISATIGYAGIERPLAELARPGVVDAIWLSLATATVASVLGLLVAIPAAYALSRWSFPGRRLLDVLVDVPVVISPIAIGMMILFVFQTSAGTAVQEHLLRFVFEVPGIVLAQVIIVSALQIRVLKAAFDEVPARMETVARFLGCGPWGAFWRVTLPLARPGLVCALILGWARAVGEFGATVTVAGAIRGKTETIPIAIGLHWGAVRLDAAIGLVLLLVAVALLVLVAVRWIAGKLA